MAFLKAEYWNGGITPALVQGFAGGSQCLQDDLIALRRQARLDDQSVMLVVVEFDVAIFVYGICPLAFGNGLNLAVIAH